MDLCCGWAESVDPPSPCHAPQSKHLKYGTVTMSCECQLKHSLVLRAILNFLGAGTTAVRIRAAHSVPSLTDSVH